MARIKTIWGPHKTARSHSRIMWTFTGIRANGEQAEWRLTFYADTRTFRTRAKQSKQARHAPMTEADMFQLPEVARAETIDGAVTPLLKARLTDAHLAEATALALAYGNR